MIKKNRRIFIISLLFMMTVSLSACQWDQYGKAITTGTGVLIGTGAAIIISDKNNISGYKKIALIAGGAAISGFLANQFAKYLDEKDRETHIKTTSKALTTGRTQSWNNPNTKISGRSEIVKSVIKTSKVSVPVLKNKISRVPPLDLIGKLYRANKISNIRGGPGTEYKEIDKLMAGDVVNVVGKVQGKNWYMISQQGVGSGFVYASLLKSAPTAILSNNQKSINSEVQVETKSTEASMTCRTVKQTITLEDGREKHELIKACQGANGWEVIKT